MTDDRPPASESRPIGILEALVGLSILVSLAGVLIPMVGAEVAGSQRDQALADMQQVVSGLRDYSNSTLYLPTGTEGRTNVSWLYGPGELPSGNPFASGGEGHALEDVLLNDGMAGPRWDGPYFSGPLDADPWGHAYLLNVEGLVTGRESAMVLSAGPDGVVDTAAEDRQARGDDIILPIN